MGETLNPQFDQMELPNKASPATTNPELSAELIAEIFIKLPATPLVRFRCVSNSWRSRLIEPSFTSRHFQLHSRYKRLIFNCFSVNDGNYIVSRPLSCILDDDNGNIDDGPLKLAHPPPMSLSTRQSRVRLWSSCRGLLCVEHVNCFGDTVSLWNPMTRVIKGLKHSPFENAKHPLVCYDLGYDTAHDDYVVVRMARERGVQAQYKAEMKLYSLKYDSWKRIKNFPYSNAVMDCGSKFLSGAFHWLAFYNEYGRGFGEPMRVVLKIVSLNLLNERYGEIPQPRYSKVPDLEKQDDVRITVLDGMLCMYCIYFKTSLSVWVMKCYGNQDSWIEKVTISLDATPFSSLVPKVVLENGKMLLLADGGDGKALVMYDEEQSGFTTLIPSSIEIREAIVFEESLISPS